MHSFKSFIIMLYMVSVSTSLESSICNAFSYRVQQAVPNVSTAFEPVSLIKRQQRLMPQPTLSPLEAQRFHFILGDYDDQQLMPTNTEMRDTLVSESKNTVPVAASKSGTAEGAAAELQKEVVAAVPAIQPESDIRYSEDYLNGLLRLKGSLMGNSPSCDLVTQFRNSFSPLKFSSTRAILNNNYMKAPRQINKTLNRLNKAAMPVEFNAPIVPLHHMSRRQRDAAAGAGAANVVPIDDAANRQAKNKAHNHKHKKKYRNKKRRKKLRKKQKKGLLDSITSSLSGTFHSLTDKFGGTNVAQTGKEKKSKMHQRLSKGAKKHKKLRKTNKQKKLQIKEENAATATAEPKLAADDWSLIDVDRSKCNSYSQAEFKR